MFETLNELAKKLPHPDVSGDHDHDQRVRQRDIENAKCLRSEACRCIGRAARKTMIATWRRLTAWLVTSHAHHA